MTPDTMFQSREADLNELRENASRATAFLRGMANEYRLMILCRLWEAEHTVKDLEDDLQLSQSALSQHLAVLRRLGLVNVRKDARLHYYSLANDDAAQILMILYQKFCSIAV